MTSTTQEPEKKSYTTRLKEFLEENKCPKKYLDLISEFALNESERREQEKEATKGVMTFGKFKGRQLKQIYEIEPTYIKWLKKNNQFLSEPNREIVDELLSQ